MRRCGTVLGLLLLCAMPGRSASAREGLDAKLFDPVPSPHAILNTHAARMLGHLDLYAGVTFDYANDLLRAEQRGRTIYRFIQHRVTSELGLAVGLWECLDLGLSLPIFLRQTSESFPAAGNAGETGVGDLRLLPKLGILRQREGTGLGLAVVAELSLPTGDADRLMGDPGGVTFTPRLVVDYLFRGGLAVALNAGYRVRRHAQLGDLTVDDEIRLGAGAELPLRFLDLSAGLELNAAIGLGSSAVDPSIAELRKSPLELLGLLRWRSRSGVEVHLASGTGLTAGYGAPDIRAVLGVGYHLGWSRLRAVSAAAVARTGVTPVRLDRRAGSGERRGSPAPAGPLPLAAAALDQAVALDPDRDGDGLPDERDGCPEAAEDPDGFEDQDGCPDPDNDRDGVPDTADRCPLEPETVNGIDDDDGCPDSGSAAVSIVGGKVEIRETIHFASGSDVLQPASNQVLEQVAAFLKAHWAIRLVRIEGHTDDRGDKEMNVDLSERRARRVMAVLVSNGVAAHRLEARGYGPTVPIASNGTAPGRTANRRVEFAIVTMVKPEARP